MKPLIVASLFASGLAFAAPAALANVAAGVAAPDFTLTDIGGKAHKLSAYKGKYVVLEWFNSECPFVQKHYDSGNMQSLQKKYGDKGVVWLVINSTSTDSDNYRSPAQSQGIVKSWSMVPAALMLDTEGNVGQTYGARTTPQMWVVDPGGKVIYAGGIDDKPTFRTADVKGAKNYVAAALDESMAGKPVTTTAAAPYGCSVKYKY
ncbi:MAG: thioredoxin family protein [Xanthobacteraceae bacterium]|nr:thioredoxin family protein [Xanthobacteraceae bacterium]